MSFSAHFHFGTWCAVQVEEDGLTFILSGGSRRLASSLDEAIPQLERVLEIAKMIVNQEAQEATDGE